MKLYDLITEEDTDVLPEMEGDRKTHSFNIESPQGDSANIVVEILKVREENPGEDEYMFFIDINNLKYTKCDAYTMSRVLNQIGIHLINMIDNERIYEWSYKIIGVSYYLGKINDTQFKVSFDGGGSDFNNTIINRKKNISDMFANIARPEPFKLDIDSIEKEYYKAKKRLDFIQSVHFG